MDVPATELQQRRIGNPTHNSYVAEGIDRHRPTRMAPLSLLRAMSPTKMRELKLRYGEVKKSLIDAIGSPLYSDSGFFLYCGDSSELLPRLVMRI